MAQAIPAEVRERIISAALEIYEEGGRESWPTVDAVRRAARADMNATSAVMREWRRAQTAQAAPVAVVVPEIVQQASNTALAALWQQAQELANESLRSAQAAWETERAELDGLRSELANAFERQAGELEAAQSRLASIEAAEAAARGKADELRGQLAAAQEQAKTAETRAQEIERRAGELRTDLDRAREELATVRARAAAERDTHQEQRKAAAAEAHRMAERLTATQTGREQAMKAAAQAREEAARLAGELAALKEQNGALLARLTPAAGAKKRG